MHWYSVEEADEKLNHREQTDCSMHWYSVGERERERERSTSSNFASHTGGRSRLAFPVRERSASSHIVNSPSCLSQKSSSTRLGLCRRLERGSLSAPRRRREKKLTTAWQRGPRIRCTVWWGGGAALKREKRGGGEGDVGGAYEARARRAVGCRHVLLCVRAVLQPAPLAPLKTRTS